MPDDEDESLLIFNNELFVFYRMKPTQNFSHKATLQLLKEIP
jgi:hypothetical protein